MDVYTAAPRFREYAFTLTPVEPQDLTWQDAALCAEIDGDLFFPEKGGSVRIPKQICLGCPVRQPCLEYALETDQAFGIWGGMSEQERRRIQRQRAARTTITPRKAAA